MESLLSTISAEDREALRKSLGVIARIVRREDGDEFAPPGHDDDERELWCVQFLLGRGYAVEKAIGDWETPAQLCTRLGLSKRSFSRRLKRTKFMPFADIERGQRRIIRIRSNPNFDRWLQFGRVWGHKS